MSMLVHTAALVMNLTTTNKLWLILLYFYDRCQLASRELTIVIIMVQFHVR